MDSSKYQMVRQAYQSFLQSGIYYLRTLDSYSLEDLITNVDLAIDYQKAIRNKQILSAFLSALRQVVISRKHQQERQIINNRIEQLKHMVEQKKRCIPLWSTLTYFSRLISNGFRKRITSRSVFLNNDDQEGYKQQAYLFPTPVLLLQKDESIQSAEQPSLKEDQLNGQE